MSGVITAKDAIRAISEDNFNFDWINPEYRGENGRFKGNCGDNKSNNNDIKAKIDSFNSIDLIRDN